MLDRPTLPVDDITRLAANSALARRKLAPLGYVKGMAVMFATVQRKLAQGDPAALEMAKPASSDRIATRWPTTPPRSRRSACATTAAASRRCGICSC